MDWGQSCKWVGEKTNFLDTIVSKLWYIGKNRWKKNMSVILDKDWKKRMGLIKGSRTKLCREN